TRALGPSAVHVVGKPLIVVHAAYSLEVFLEKVAYESDLLAACGQARLEETWVQDHVPRVRGQPSLDVPHAPQAILPHGLRCLDGGKKSIRVDVLEIRIALGQVQGERVAPQEDPGAWWYEALEVLGREPELHHRRWMDGRYGEQRMANDNGRIENDENRGSQNETPPPGCLMRISEQSSEADPQQHRRQRRPGREIGR